MITNTRQNWLVGSVVKVGFLTLRVLGAEAVKDGLPDIYTLSRWMAQSTISSSRTTDW